MRSLAVCLLFSIGALSVSTKLNFNFDLRGNETAVFEVAITDLTTLHLASLNAENPFVSLTISFCRSLPGVSILHSTNTTAAVVISPEYLLQIRDVTHCPDEVDPFYQKVEGVNDTRVFLSVSSPNSTKGVIGWRESRKRNKSSLGAQAFTVSGNRYVTVEYTISSLDDFIKIESTLKYGKAKIFATFCADFQGQLLGSIEYPRPFEVSLNGSKLLELVDKNVCPNEDLMYVDFHRHPPRLLVRIQSENASGYIHVYDEKEKVETVSTFVPLIRNLLQKEMHIGLHANSSHQITIHLSDANDTIQLEFDVKFGSFEVFLEGCDMEEDVLLANYTTGVHELTLEGSERNSSSSCIQNVTPKVNLKIVGIENSEFTVKDRRFPDEDEGNSNLTAYILIGVGAFVAISLVILGVLFSIHRREGRSSTSSSGDEQDGPTYNIPMTENWT